MTHPIDRAWEPDPGSDESYALFAKEHRVLADDGTPIAYTVRGADGPRVPVLFANGWSCSDAYWGGLLPALEALGHPCILPDTRGHGRSGLPRPPGRGARNLTVDDVAMARIARDLLSVLHHADYDHVLVVGHSMGVQTALELYRQAPERVVGQVFIAGTFENPAKTFYGTSIGDRLFPLMGGAMRWFPEIVKPVQATIGPAQVGHFGARLSRAAGPKTTSESLHPYLLHLKGIDIAVLVLMAAAMRAHSAADVLGRISVPTLIVAAGADLFTPARCSETMHHRIADSELITFPEGAHTLPVEEPVALAAAIDDFVARRVGPPSGQKRTARTSAKRQAPNRRSSGAAPNGARPGATKGAGRATARKATSRKGRPDFIPPPTRPT